LAAGQQKLERFFQPIKPRTSISLSLEFNEEEFIEFFLPGHFPIPARPTL
jgi:hypothetical protein